MFPFLGVCFGTLVRLFCSRRSLLLENLALRQQLSLLKRRHPRPRLDLLDRFFWLLARRFWSGWKQALFVVTPETVVRWHRAGFRWYWGLISKVSKPKGRRPTSKVVRDLIFRLVTENPSWGAPRIHGELLMLGFNVSERTISRWMKQAPKDLGPGKNWLTFLRNHKEAIAAMDFFTVPTVTFSVLNCFFIIGHHRRRILHFNVTKHPTTLWIVQQLREAFPLDSAPRFLILDRDAKYGLDVPVAVRSLSINPVQTSFESPWQNGIAERWVGSCRRDLLDHIIALNECHLRRLLSEYVRYHHEDRTHLGLAKQHQPAELPVQLPVGSCLTHDLVGCTIATIGLPDLILRRTGRAGKLGWIIPSFAHLRAAAGGIWAVDEGFLDQFLRRIQAFARRNNEIKLFWRGSDCGEGQGSGTNPFFACPKSPASHGL